MRTPEDSAYRQTSYGQNDKLSVLDRFGTWLNFRSALSLAAPGMTAIDVGCGFDVRLGRALSARGLDVTAVDVAVDDVSGIRCITGFVPDVLGQFEDGQFDLAYCVNVLEHLEDPLTALVEIRRVVTPDGTVFVNVPSWRGKWFLEFAAFRLGLAPAEEMNDHKMYYDTRDLWPLAVRAGFEPCRIRCQPVKAGLNTRLVVKSK